MISEKKNPNARLMGPSSGYLYYVTDTRNSGYWRPYVGQTTTHGDVWVNT